MPTRPRRPRGEGSLYQVRSGPRAGAWRAQLRLPDGTRRNFYGASRHEVADRLASAREHTRHGLPIPPAQLTLDKHLDDWLAATRDTNRPRTWASYDDNCRRYLRPHLGRRRLADLRPADVRAFHRALRDKGLSGRTIQFADRVLRMALDQAVADGLVPRNVAKLVHAPSGKRPEVRPFEPHEALRFVEAARGDRLEALYVATLGLGLRRGEALGLRWRDVDWDHGTVTVAGQLLRLPRNVGGGLVWQAPKTRASVAVLHAPAFVLDALRAHRDRQAFEREAAAELWRDHGYVFCSPSGAPLDPDTVSHAFPRLLARGGLRHVRFHDLRHSAASLLLAKGTPLIEVSRLLRHAGIAITGDTYGHLYAESGRALATTMDQILTRPPRP